MFSELVARNSRRSRRENGLFFTSLVISIIAFYIILSLSHQDVMVFLQRMESSAVDRLLSLVPVLYGLTLFILFFLVYYANRFQLARRRHEFGVYLMLGMQRRKLFGMLLAEDLRSSLIALAIGLPAALLILEVISLVTARLVGLGIVGHRFTLSLSAIGWTAVGFLAIKLLASLILSGKIVREEIGALLTETPEGTKKQRPAAVYAAALVLSIALLAAAYALAIGGLAWSDLRCMAGTIALGVGGHAAAVLRPARHHRLARPARRPRGQAAGVQLPSGRGNGHPPLRRACDLLAADSGGAVLLRRGRGNRALVPRRDAHARLHLPH